MYISTSTAVLLSSFAVAQALAKIPCLPSNDWCGRGAYLDPFSDDAPPTTLRGTASLGVENNPILNVYETRDIGNDLANSRRLARRQGDSLEALKKRRDLSIMPRRPQPEVSEEDKTMHILPVEDNKSSASPRRFDDTTRRPITHCAGLDCSGPNDYVPAINERLIYARDVEDPEDPEDPENLEYVENELEKREAPEPEASPAPFNFNSAKFRDRLPNSTPFGGSTVTCAGTIEACSGPMSRQKDDDFLFPGSSSDSTSFLTSK